MSSTNKTPILGLNQFLGTDKPTFTGDYNADMAAVDVFATGWIPLAGNFTYLSATQITIPGDVTARIFPGRRIKMTQSTVKYFIVMAAAYNGSITTLTLYGGTDYTIANVAINNVYYSPMKSPAGFPLDPMKWSILVRDTTNRGQNSPVSNTWYNVTPVSIAIPVGCWRVSVQMQIRAQITTVTTYQLFSTLSTSNNSETDVDFTTFRGDTAYSAGGWITEIVKREKMLTLASGATYYPLVKLIADITMLSQNNNASPLILRAECAYL